VVGGVEATEVVIIEQAPMCIQMVFGLKVPNGLKLTLVKVGAKPKIDIELGVVRLSVDQAIQKKKKAEDKSFH
jgi:hypothetical protein